MSATDEFAEWDAAYVLGALSSADRERFERHLEECPRCREGVAQLAGMPGLLAQVSPAEALAMGTPVEPSSAPPETLMPELPADEVVVDEVAAVDDLAARRESSRAGDDATWEGRPARRWGRWGTPLAAAAAALLIGGVGGYAASQWGGRESPAPSASASTTAGVSRVAFTPLTDARMSAVVDLVPVRNGTELRVECQYARPTGTARPTKPSGDGGYALEYSLWVRDHVGNETWLSSWTAKPDVLMHPVAVSSLPVKEIRALEIRQVDTGRTLMRAELG